jgi:hypothetical protein
MSEAAQHSPLGEVRLLQSKVGEATAAMHRAADSMERHVLVVESLATSVPALTESVNRLVGELNGLLGVLAPLAAAEHEITRARHLFGHHQRSETAVSPEVGAPGGQAPGEVQAPGEPPPPIN